METAIAPPPSTPAPAPTPVPSPPPAPTPGAPVAPPTPEPKTEVKPGDHLNDAFANLDELVTKQDAPEAKPEPKATEKKEPVKPAPKSEPAKSDAPAQPEKAATLRANYDKVKSEYAALEKKHKELEAKLAQPQEYPERKELQSKIASYEKLIEAKEKKLGELDSELKFTKYERSQEYKDKYETPWIEAYTDGRNRVAQLRIKEPDVVDPSTGEVTAPGKVRQGTEADFDTLMGIANDDDAAEFAAKLFGNKAAIVLTQREKVRDLNGARIKAIEDYRKQGGEREKQMADLTKKQRDAFVENWQKENAAAAEKYPQWFKPEEGDDKGNTLLEKGIQQADKAFSGTENMSPEEAVRLLSAVRNKAAGFDRLAYKFTKATARIAELEAKLKAFEESEPGGGEGGGEGAPATQPDGMEAVVSTLEKLAK